MKVFSATDIGQKRTMNQDFVLPPPLRSETFRTSLSLQTAWEAITRAILLRVTVFLYWWNL